MEIPASSDFKFTPLQELVLDYAVTLADYRLIS